MGRFREKTENRLSLYVYQKDECRKTVARKTVAVLKHTKLGHAKSVATNAGKVLMALFNCSDNSTPHPIDPRLLHKKLGSNPARAWRKLREYGVINIRKVKPGKQSFELSWAEEYVPLFKIFRFYCLSPFLNHPNEGYNFVNDVPDVTRARRAVLLFNKINEDGVKIKRVIMQTPREQTEIKDKLKAFFIGLRPLTLLQVNKIAAYAGFDLALSEEKKWWIQRKEDRACCLILVS